MIVQKNSYLSALLVVILLASTSIGFASEEIVDEGQNIEQPSWGQWARNIGSSTYDYASRGAQSAWDYAKPYTPYIPAAALAGLGAYGLGKNMDLRYTNQYLSPVYENLLSAAILSGLIGSPLAATSARYYNRQSQAPEERSNRWWDLAAPVAIPAALALAYGPSERKLNSAAWTAFLTSIPTLAYARYLANEEKQQDALNQIAAIESKIEILNNKLEEDALKRRREDFESMGHLPQNFETYNKLITDGIVKQIATLEAEKANLLASMQ